MCNAMKILSSVILLVSLHLVSAGKMVSIITTGKGDLQYLNDFRFDVSGSRSLVFDVKICSDATIVLHETHAYYHNAFEVVIGGGANSWSSISGKCRGCPTQTTKKERLLDCDVFKTFWLSWMNPLTVKVGVGGVVGSDTRLVYKAEVNIPINYLYVTSSNYYQGYWKIEIDKTPWFLYPPQYKWTAITVREDVSVGSVLYNVSTEDQTDSLDLIRDPGRQYFTINKSQLLLIRKLDYGERQFVDVLIRASNRWGSVNQSLVINVQDVPEAPLITLAEDLRVVEELPHGTPLPGLITVTDDDVDENLTYSLHGQDSQYFSIDPNTGELRTDHRLDRERPGNEVLDQLNLLVEDSTGRQSLKVLTITVADVDEFPTHCEQNTYYVSVTEDGVMGPGNPLLVFNCSDGDWGASRTFGLLGNGSGHVFWLQRVADTFELSLDRKQFDFDELRGPDDAVTLTVVDDSVHEVNTSYTTIAVIKIVRNKQLPEWVWPPLDANGTVPEIHVMENVSDRVVICTLNATGAVVYSIKSLKTATGDPAPLSLFKIHPSTGDVTVNNTLDGDRDTGGSEFYVFTVTAEGARPTRGRIESTFRLFVIDVNDNAPRFAHALSIVDVECPTQRNPVITRILTRDSDVVSKMKFAMSPSRQLKIDPTNGDLRWRDDPQKGISGHKYGEADLQQFMGYGGIEDSVRVSPHLNRRLKPPFDLLKVVVIDSEHPEKMDSTYVLVKFECSAYVSVDGSSSSTVDGWLFKAISGILAVILLIIGGYYVAKRTVLKSMLTKVTPQNSTTTDGEADADDKITHVQQLRDSPSPEQGDSANRRSSAGRGELSIIDLTGPHVPENHNSQSTTKT